MDMKTHTLKNKGFATGWEGSNLYDKHRLELRLCFSEQFLFWSFRILITLMVVIVFTAQKKLVNSNSAE